MAMRAEFYIIPLVGATQVPATSAGTGSAGAAGGLGMPTDGAGLGGRRGVPAIDEAVATAWSTVATADVEVRQSADTLVIADAAIATTAKRVANDILRTFGILGGDGGTGTSGGDARGQTQAASGTNSVTSHILFAMWDKLFAQAVETARREGRVSARSAFQVLQRGRDLRDALLAGRAEPTGTATTAPAPAVSSQLFRFHCNFSSPRTFPTLADDGDWIPFAITAREATLMISLLSGEVRLLVHGETETVYCTACWAGRHWLSAEHVAIGHDESARRQPLTYTATCACSQFSQFGTRSYTVCLVC